MNIVEIGWFIFAFHIVWDKFFLRVSLASFTKSNILKEVEYSDVSVSVSQ